MDVLHAPLEGASVSLRKSDGGTNSQRYHHERSSLPIPAPSPPPQTICNGDNSGTSHLGAGRSQDTPSTGYRKSSESAPLIGIGPESPTVISSPTGILTISTGLSPTKAPCRGSLAPAASGLPGPVGYYPSSSYNQPSFHTASPSVSAFTPNNTASGAGAYTGTQPLYMTKRPSTAVASAGCGGSQPASNTAGLPQGQSHTEDGHGYGGPATKDTSCGGASLASLDSSSFFAITQQPLSSTSTSDPADLERMLLRRSPETAPTTSGGAQMPMITATAQQQQHHRFQTTVNPGPLRDFDAFDVRLVDGGGLDDFPAVVGGICGGYVGGPYDSSGESSGGNAGGNAGGRRGSGIDGVSFDREIGGFKLEEGGDKGRGEQNQILSVGSQRERERERVLGECRPFKSGVPCPRS